MNNDSISVITQDENNRNDYDINLPTDCSKKIEIINSENENISLSNKSSCKINYDLHLEKQITENEGKIESKYYLII